MGRGGLHLLPGAAGRSRLLHLFQTAAMHIVNVAINRNAYRYQWVLADSPDILQHGGPGRGSTARHHPPQRQCASNTRPPDLVGCGLSLDRRAAGQRGAAAVNPHGLVQEFLNRSPAHLWGMVSNGLRLRILRDNQALSRMSPPSPPLGAVEGAKVTVGKNNYVTTLPPLGAVEGAKVTVATLG